MMDDLLSNLYEVASLLVPIVGVVVLIILAMLLYRVYVFLKKLPETLDKVDNILESSNKSIDKLDKPLETLNNISGTVDMVNNATQDAVSSITSFSMKHSETAMNSVKDFMDRKKGSKDSPRAEEDIKEDFGVYDE